MEHEPGQIPQPLTLSEVVRIAQETILKDGHHVPTILVDGSRTGTGILVEMAESHQKRLLQMFIAGAALGETGTIGTLRQVFLITEAWMGRIAPENPVMVQPSQDPNRVEVLLVTRLNQKGENTLAMFEMIRDGSGTLTDLLETSQQEGGTASSPLLESFVIGFNLGRSKGRRHKK